MRDSEAEMTLSTEGTRTGAFQLFTGPGLDSVTTGVAVHNARFSPYLAGDGDSTLIEAQFPAREVSLVMAADRRAIDPRYAAHRWWARRPPALMRAVVLAAALRDSTSPATFWDAYRVPEPLLHSLTVYDPFAGGGGTLVEAARLGSLAIGRDIDPLAVQIIKHEMAPPSSDRVERAGRRLVEHLIDQFIRLYPSADTRSKPLHYFWLHRVTCPSCGVAGLLYRNLILARDVGKVGAVVRDSPLTVFCPEDLAIHDLSEGSQRQLLCCGKQWPIGQGTFTPRGRYKCPACGAKSTHHDLLTGKAPRVLVAVEDTVNGQHRRIRPPTEADRQALRHTDTLLERTPLRMPDIQVAVDREDRRPVSYGIETYTGLFTSRQLIVISNAISWIQEAGLEADIRRALLLGVSNSLATNNKLCTYAVDYGRLSGLFSVRGYALPALSVELNPLHPDSGRGTISQCLHRVARSGTNRVRRYTWSVQQGVPEPLEMVFPPPVAGSTVTCAAAADRLTTDTPVDLCIFDPPYYDLINYASLSAFHRAWLPLDPYASGGLVPEGDNPVETFGASLADSLRAMMRRLARGRPLIFTYHSSHWDAWQAVGIALDRAELAVTAVWPVRTDGHMGPHSHPGNCEWDLILCCRRRNEVRSAKLTASVDRWVDEMAPLRIAPADRENLGHALRVAEPRFAVPLAR